MIKAYDTQKALSEKSRVRLTLPDGNQVGYTIPCISAAVPVDILTDEGQIISIVRDMDDRSVQRALGYLLAMREFNKDNPNGIKSGK